MANETAREEWTHQAMVSYKLPVDLIQSKLPPSLTVVPFEENNEKHAIVSEWYFYQANARNHPNIMPKWVGYLAAAPDIHLQTYVIHEDGREGLFCFKMWMGKALPCWIGRNFYQAPLYAGNQSLNEDKNGLITHKCEFTNSTTKQKELATLQYKKLDEGNKVALDSLDFFTVNRFARKQFTYFKDKLNCIPNQFEDRLVFEVEAELNSNLLSTVLEIDHIDPVRIVAFSDTLCRVFASE